MKENFVLGKRTLTSHHRPALLQLSLEKLELFDFPLEQVPQILGPLENNNKNLSMTQEE